MTVKFQFNLPHNHVGACVCLERMKNVGEWTFWTIYYIKIVTTTKCFVHTEFNTKMTTHTATLALHSFCLFPCVHQFCFVSCLISFFFHCNLNSEWNNKKNSKSISFTNVFDRFRENKNTTLRYKQFEMWNILDWKWVFDVIREKVWRVNKKNSIKMSRTWWVRNNDDDKRKHLL